jgi:anti-sigma factor RsiW
VAAFTDEILMAYADGVLEGEARARIEALIKVDTQARARVLLFKATGQALAGAYEGVLQEPVPAHLIQFVMDCGKEREESPAPGPASLNLAPAASPWPSRLAHAMGLWGAWRDRLIPQGAGWQLAAASALVLIAGAGASFLFRGDGGVGPNLAALRPGQALTRGVLHQVLETLPSNEERAAGGSQGAAAARAVLTFKAKDGSYCREYEVTTAQGHSQGLACRQAGGDWTVEQHVGQKAAAAGAQPAGQGQLLDQAVDSRIEGIAFGDAEEKAAIKNGWK